MITTLCVIESNIRHLVIPMNSNQQDDSPKTQATTDSKSAPLERKRPAPPGEAARSGNYLQELVSVQEAERQRISRDLHDSLGQLLTGLRMEFTLLQNRLAQPDLNRSESIASVQRADRVVERIQKSVRHLISFLQPKIVIDEGLSAAIHSIIREYERFGDVEYETTVELDERELDRNRAIAVYRIVQECLTNVIRHAKASRVHLRCVCEQGGLSLQIDDDGVGYDTTAESTGEGWGLFGMRARVEWLKGTFSISSVPGRGTRIDVEIPLPKD